MALTHEQAAKEAVASLKKEKKSIDLKTASLSALGKWRKSHSLKKGEKSPKGTYKAISDKVSKLIPKTIEVSEKKTKAKKTKSKVDLGHTLSAAELKKLALGNKISPKAKKSFCDDFDLAKEKEEIKKKEKAKKARKTQKKKQTKKFGSAGQKALSFQRKEAASGIIISEDAAYAFLDKNIPKKPDKLLNLVASTEVSVVEDGVKKNVETPLALRKAAMKLARKLGATKKQYSSVKRKLEKIGGQPAEFMKRLDYYIETAVDKKKPKKSKKRAANPRKRNPSGALGALADAFTKSDVGAIAMQLGSGTLGYMLPGLAQMGFKAAGITEWLTKNLKTTEKKASLVASTAGFVGSFLIGVGMQKSDFVKKSGAAMVIGAGIRFARDLIDSLVEPTTDTNKKIRTAFGLSGYGVWSPALSGYGVWSPAMQGYGVWSPAMSGYGVWRPALGAGPAPGYQLSGPPAGYQLGAWGGNWQKRW